MPFSIVIFVAALWALSTEMAEDSIVDLIYGHMYGWRTLVYALLTASVILTIVSAVSIYYALAVLTRYLDLVKDISAVFLGLIGLFWLLTSTIFREKESDIEETREKLQKRTRSTTRNFMIVLQLVIIEELEILLILIPLIIASHALEAGLAATIGIVASVTTAAVLRRNFEKIVEGRLRQLKIISGLFLLGLAVVLFTEA